MPCSHLLPLPPVKAGGTHPLGAAEDEGGYRCEKLIESFPGGRGSRGEPGKLSDSMTSYQWRSHVETSCHSYYKAADAWVGGGLGTRGTSVPASVSMARRIGDRFNRCFNFLNSIDHDMDAGFERPQGSLSPWR